MPDDDDAVAGALARLCEQRPQSVGTCRHHWAEAKTGLDDTDRNYATVSQIRANIPEPTASSRALGNTLTVLAALDVLDVHTERNTATVYDLRAYEPGRLATVGRLLEQSTESI